MTDMKNDLAIAVFDRHTKAEEAVRALEHAGFDMKKISIIARDYQKEEHILGFLNIGDRVTIFGKYGALWGGFMGILFGSAMMFIPVLGHIIVLGPLAATLFSAVEGAVIVGGLSALAGALISLGIPRDSVLRYESALKADNFLLVVHGDVQEIEHARGLLKTSGFSSFQYHGSADLPSAITM
jgi:uncharacterized membrane protein